MKSLNQLLSLVLLAAGILFFNSQAQAITLKGCVGYKFVPIIGYEEYICWAKGKRYIVTGERYGFEFSGSARGAIKLGGKKLTGRHCGLSVSVPGFLIGPEFGIRGSKKNKSLSIEGGPVVGFGASVGSCVDVREYGTKAEQAEVRNSRKKVKQPEADPYAQSLHERAFGVDQ